MQTSPTSGATSRSPSSAPPASALAQRLYRLAPYAALGFVAVGTIVWARRPGDFAGYLTVGDLVLAGKHIYRDAPPGLNTWPPFFSLWCVPLAVLAHPTPVLARVVWLLLNFYLLWVTLRLLTRLIHHRDLSLFGRHGLPLASTSVLLPVALCYRFILGNFDHLQVNIVIFCCVVAGLWWHVQRRDAWAGVAVGLAAALKVMPVIFVPYFAYRRQYRIAIYSGLAAAGFSLSPILVYGRQRFIDYVWSWRDAVTLGWGVGKMNQSVFAMLDRFIGHGITPLTATAVNYLPESHDPVVTWATAGVLAAIAVAALVVFRGPITPDSPAAIAEYSIVLIISALFGPLAWKAYLIVLLCPCILLVSIARNETADAAMRRVAITALVIFFALAGVTAPGVVGSRNADLFEMLSSTTWGALAILLAVFWLRTGRVSRFSTDHGLAGAG